MEVYIIRKCNYKELRGVSFMPGNMAIRKKGEIIAWKEYP
jgi:hypothetical protein